MLLSSWADRPLQRALWDTPACAALGRTNELRLFEEEAALSAKTTSLCWGGLWVVTAASESKEEKGLTQLMGAHLLSVVLVFVSKLANRFLCCWFYVLRMISVPQCATASHRVVTEAVVCRGSVQNHLLNRNLLMRHAQCGCCVIPFLALNGNITETFCWNGSCWSQSSNGSVKELKIRESVVAPSPLTVGLLCSALGPSFGKNRQINAKGVAGQQNYCCSGKTSTLHFLAVWAVHVSGLFFMLQWFLHSSPLSPSGFGPFRNYLPVHTKGKTRKYKAVPWEQQGPGCQWGDAQAVVPRADATCLTVFSASVLLGYLFEGKSAVLPWSLQVLDCGPADWFTAGTSAAAELSVITALLPVTLLKRALSVMLFCGVTNDPLFILGSCSAAALWGRLMLHTQHQAPGKICYHKHCKRALAGRCECC